MSGGSSPVQMEMYRGVSGQTVYLESSVDKVSTSLYVFAYSPL